MGSVDDWAQHYDKNMKGLLKKTWAYVHGKNKIVVVNIPSKGFALYVNDILQVASVTIKRVPLHGKLRGGERVMAEMILNSPFEIHLSIGDSQNEDDNEHILLKHKPKNVTEADFLKEQIYHEAISTFHEKYIRGSIAQNFSLAVIDDRPEMKKVFDVGSFEKMVTFEIDEDTAKNFADIIEKEHDMFERKVVVASDVLADNYVLSYHFRSVLSSDFEMINKLRSCGYEQLYKCTEGLSENRVKKMMALLDLTSKKIKELREIAKELLKNPM
ncbi:MAG: hypothetical protein LBV13_02510 [Methanomassiliicoccaceae archaeon]|jgi:hypothetical protein|nr:hypothetical protein [Methanomassiliicoccaceae archaeon]